MSILLYLAAPAVLVALGWALVCWRLLPVAAESVPAAFSVSVAIPALLFVSLVEVGLELVLVGILPGIALLAQRSSTAAR